MLKYFRYYFFIIIWLFNLAFILFFSPFRRLLIRFFHLHEEHYNTKSLHFSSHFVCLLVCLLGLLLVSLLLLGFYSVVYFASLFIWFSGMNSIPLGLCIIIIFVCLFLPKFDTSFLLLLPACGCLRGRSSTTKCNTPNLCFFAIDRFNWTYTLLLKVQKEKQQTLSEKVRK